LAGQWELADNRDAPARMFEIGVDISGGLTDIVCRAFHHYGSPPMSGRTISEGMLDSFTQRKSVTVNLAV
jgi:hypothetical protein